MQCLRLFILNKGTNSGWHFHYINLECWKGFAQLSQETSPLIASGGFHLSNLNRNFSHFFWKCNISFSITTGLIEVSGFSRRAAIYHNVRTCEVFLCFVAIVRVRVLTSCFLCITSLESVRWWNQPGKIVLTANQYSHPHVTYTSSVRVF